MDEKENFNIFWDGENYICQAYMVNFDGLTEREVFEGKENREITRGGIGTTPSSALANCLTSRLKIIY